MKIKAVIFDMDGLMLDTERLGLDIFRKVTVELGLGALDELYLSVVGRNAIDTRTVFLEALGAEFPFDDMFGRWRHYNEEHISNLGVPLKPGLLRLLQRLQFLGLPRAVATSTPRNKAQFLLSKVDILQHFDAVVGGDETRLGKPDPEIFLLAARRLNAEPAECVVFEDSAPGIRAAHAGGMIPVLIPDLFDLAPAVTALAYRVYRSLDDAHELFDKE